MATIAIIPARGRSKSIPRKKIKLLAGKPLIVHTIKIVLKCELLDRVIASNNDEEIAAISKKYGAEVPFIRPKELALEITPILPVLQHAICKVRRHPLWSLLMSEIGFILFQRRRARACRRAFIWEI